MKPCSVHTVTYADAKMQQTRLGVKKQLSLSKKLNCLHDIAKRKYMTRNKLYMKSFKISYSLLVVNNKLGRFKDKENPILFISGTPWP